MRLRLRCVGLWWGDEPGKTVKCRHFARFPTPWGRMCKAHRDSYWGK